MPYEKLQHYFGLQIFKSYFLNHSIHFQDPNDQKKYLLTGADKSGGNFTFSLANFNSLDSGRVVCGVSDVLPAEIQLELFGKTNGPKMHFLVRNISLCVIYFSCHIQDEPQDISIAIHSQHRLLWSGGAIPKFQHLVQDTVNMTCTVYNSIPKGIIRWLINGTEAGKINTTEKYEVTSILLVHKLLSRIYDLFPD